MPLTSSLSGGSNIGSGGGGARADILLVLKFLTEGIKDAEKARKEIEKINKAAEETGEGGKGAKSMFDTFKKGAAVLATTTAALFGVGKALDVILDLSREGAGFRQMVESFDMLGHSIGADTDLLYQLQNASRGTIDNMNLMSSAAVTLAGTQGEFGTELANNLPRILEIAKAAEKMNPALGDTDFMFRSLTVGLKRLSPRLIDNTGLQIRLSEAYEKMAEKLGKSTQKLTSEEQQMALMNATLEAGNILIRQAGDNVESATDIYAQWDTNIENLKNTMKAWLDLNFGQKFMTSMNLLIFGNQKIEDSYEKQIEIIRTSSDNFQQYVERVSAVAVATGQITKEQRSLMLVAAGLEAELADVYSGLTDKTQIKIARNMMEEIGIILDAQFELIKRNKNELVKLAKEGIDPIETSVLGLGAAYSALSSDQDKMRIGTMLFGGALTETQEVLKRQHLDLLQVTLATKGLTDEQRAHVNGVVDAIEAELDFNQTLRDTAQAERDAADEARNAKSAFQEMFEGLLSSSTISSQIQGMKSTIAFYKAGGQEISNLWKAVAAAAAEGSVPFEELIPIMDLIFAKTQMIGVETGDISNYEAVVAVMREMNIEYDVGLAKKRAGELYDRKIIELQEEGKDITDATRRKTEDWADLQAELEQKYIATLETLKDIEGVDITSLFTSVLPPEWLTPEGFAQLTDELQALLTDIGITFTPSAEGDPSTWLDPTQMPEDLDIAVKPYISADTPDEVKNVIKDTVPDALMNLAVVDNMQPALRELIMKREIYSTIYVDIITTGSYGQLATGGQALANQPYIVGERGPELMIPGQSGYVVPNNKLSSALGGTNINVDVNAAVSNNIDMYLLARQIAEEISKNQKRR